MVIVKTTKIWIIMYIQNLIEHNIMTSQIIILKKNIGQKFVDYLGPTFFNAIHFAIKKTLRSNDKSNHKIIIYSWLLQEI